MLISSYPPQEPVPERLRLFHEQLLDLGKDVEGHEHLYGGDPAQSLIVYPCDRPGSPVLVFLHGGGWTNGYKEEVAFLAPPLNAAGFSLVSSGYRLAPKRVFPSNFDDVADAVALTCALADTYRYVSNAVFVGGHSSGGHLASLLATRADWQASRGLPTDVVKGCLPISGTFDFTPGSGLPSRPRFLGAHDAGNEVTASPLFQLHDRAAPFLMARAAQDLPHLAAQSDKFAMVARAKGVAVDVLEIEDTDHLTVLLAAAESSGKWQLSATAWMHAFAAGIAATVGR